MCTFRSDPTGRGNEPLLCATGGFVAITGLHQKQTRMLKSDRLAGLRDALTRHAKLIHCTLGCYRYCCSLAINQQQSLGFLGSPHLMMYIPTDALICRAYYRESLSLMKIQYAVLQGCVRPYPLGCYMQNFQIRMPVSMHNHMAIPVSA